MLTICQVKCFFYKWVFNIQSSNRFIYRKFHSIAISNITHKDVLFSSYRLVKFFLFVTKNSHPYQSFKVESNFLWKI